MARIGRIKILSNHIRDDGHNPNMEAVFKKFTPTSIDQSSEPGIMAYTGYNSEFDDIVAGDDIPEYVVINPQFGRMVVFARVGNVAASGYLYWEDVAGTNIWRAIVPEIDSSTWPDIASVLRRMPWIDTANRSGETIDVIANDPCGMYKSGIIFCGTQYSMTGAIYRYLNGFAEAKMCDICGGYFPVDDSTFTIDEAKLRNSLRRDCTCGHGEAHEFMFTLGGGYGPDHYLGTIHEVGGINMTVTKIAREWDKFGVCNLNIYGVPAD